MKHITKLVLVLNMVFFSLCTLQTIAQETDSAKVVRISEDADWQLVKRIHLDILDRLVSSESDIEALDFNREEDFLEAIGMSRDEYLAKADSVKAAASRINENFEISGDCETCRNDNLVGNIKTLILTYRRDVEAYNSYKNAILSENLGAISSSWCCSWAFYTCSALCAATIEVFPVYLLCCSICFKEYCCDPVKK